MECPKCHYFRTEADSHTPDGICPACGIAYKKWVAAQAAATEQVNPRNTADDEALYDDSDTNETLKEKILYWIFYVPDPIDPTVFWARVLAFLIFFVWGWWFIFTNGSWNDVGNSFLHNVNLPFHEFGHVIFRPFGRFMTILGGSLFQIMVPIIILIVFLKQGDTFEATIMFWWLGQNFIDLSPYIADAEYRGLPLIMGLGESSHDWGNLLTMMGMVDKAYYFGRMSFLTGCTIILVSFAWGAYILYQQKQNTSKW